MAKEKNKPNNPVAKFAKMFNRCSSMKNKKQAQKRGETKHKRSEEVFSDLFLFLHPSFTF
jgi:hypothetical protein